MTNEKKVLMRNPDRIPEMLNLLGVLWAKNPDARLGQLIATATWKGGWRQPDLFYCEDDATERGLRMMLDDYRRREIESGGEIKK